MVSCALGFKKKLSTNALSTSYGLRGLPQSFCNFSKKEKKKSILAFSHSYYYFLHDHSGENLSSACRFDQLGMPFS